MSAYRSKFWRDDPDERDFAEAQGELIAYHRIKYNPNQVKNIRWLGERIGCSASHIANMEAGRCRVSAITLARLAKALEVPVGKLYPEDATHPWARASRLEGRGTP